MCALAMRMQVDGFILNSTSLSGLGVSECRWLAPLRPDDAITLDVEIEQARLSGSRKGAGIVSFRAEMLNERREALMRLRLSALFGCRDAA
jgi:acyl dehydratase